MNSTELDNKQTDSAESAKEFESNEMENVTLLRRLSAETPDSPELASSINQQTTSTIDFQASNESARPNADFVYCANTAKEYISTDKDSATFADVVKEINKNASSPDDGEFTESTLAVIQELLSETIKIVVVDNQGERVSNVNQPLSIDVQNEEFQDANDKTPIQTDSLIQVVVIFFYRFTFLELVFFFKCSLKFCKFYNNKKYFKIKNKC